MASISVSPGAKNAARTLHSLIVSSRDFAEASSYRRVDPEEVTGAVPKSGWRLHPCRLRRIRRHYLPALKLTCL